MVDQATSFTPHQAPSQQQLAARRFPWIVALLLFACCVATTAFPGDAPFINDDPVLLYKALRANEAHRIERIGLIGTRGVYYGPFPTWVYQGLLLFTHDLHRLIVLHALLLEGVMAVALLSLARTMKLDAWFALPVMLCPYLWYSARMLWDNPLCIPLGAMTMAAYASFLNRPRRRTLVLAVLGLVALLLTHLMAVALVMPIGIHLLTLGLGRVMRFPWTAAAALALGLLMMWPYVSALAVVGASAHTFLAAEGLNGWWFPLLGGRVISGANLSHLFGPLWRGRGAVAGLLGAAQLVSLLAYGMVWAGIVAAGRLVYLAWRRRSIATIDHVAAILLCALLTQTVLFGLTHAYGMPHYYNGVWIIFPLFAWLALGWIKIPAARTTLIIVQSVALATITVALAIRIHHFGGIRNISYGSTLDNQMEVVERLNRLGLRGPFQFVDENGRIYFADPFATSRPTMIESDVPNYLLFSHAANVIQELNPAHATMESKIAPANVHVGYRWPDPADAHVAVFVGLSEQAD